MSKLRKFCLFTPLKVFGISILLSIIFTFYMATISQGNGFDVQIEEESILFFSLIFACTILSVGLYTIFLNLSLYVRKNILLSANSFYFFVILFVIISFLTKYDEYLYLILPFFIPLTFYFIRFRIKVNKGEFDNSGIQQDENN